MASVVVDSSGGQQQTKESERWHLAVGPSGALFSRIVLPDLKVRRCPDLPTESKFSSLDIDNVRIVVSMD